jgi:tetratricopeptide (TPR) repeat protein
LGWVEIYTNRATEGIAECERALALNPNLIHAHAAIGAAKLFMGRAEETGAHINDALRLSPRDTYAYVWLFIVGMAKLSVGRDEEAAAWLRRAIETNRNHPMAHFYLAAALAHLNRMNEAQAATQAGLAVNPVCDHRSEAHARGAGKLLLVQAQQGTGGPAWRGSMAQS